MSLLAVIYRELLVGSRSPVGWRLRLGFAVAAVLAVVFGQFWPHTQPQDRGQVILVCLATCGLAVSLFAGCFLTADSVSSEKREGTLGLLFLTPLNGWQIVAGKLISQSSVVGCAWLAVFPVFFLPVLHGGVTWGEVARLLLALLLTLGLSLACGMLWSTVGLEARTTVLATAATMVLLTFLPWLPVFLRSVFANGAFRLDGLAQLSPMTLVVQAFETNYLATSARSPLGKGIYWGAAVLSLVLSGTLIGCSGWWLPRSWRRAEAGGVTPRGSVAPERRGQTSRIARAGRNSAAPVLPAHWLAGRGSREPFWLRLLRGMSLLFFGSMLLLSVTTRHWEEGFLTAVCIAYGLHFVTRIQSSLAVTRRLFEDRRSGALELLLVTPLTEWEIVQAHHDGLRDGLRTAFRALLAVNAVLQAMVVVFARPLHMDDGAWAIFTVFFTGGALLTLSDFRAFRWLGLREALRSSTHLKAAGKVLAMLMVLPWLAFGLTFLVATRFNDEGAAAMVFALWVGFVLLYNGALVHRARTWLRCGLRRRVSEAGS